MNDIILVNNTDFTMEAIERMMDLDEARLGAPIVIRYDREDDHMFDVFRDIVPILTQRRRINHQPIIREATGSLAGGTHTHSKEVARRLKQEAKKTAKKG